MDKLHKQVQDVKELGVQAIITQDPADKARYDHAFWSLMNEHGTQILDIVDDALAAQKEE